MPKKKRKSKPFKKKIKVKAKVKKIKRAKSATQKRSNDLLFKVPESWAKNSYANKKVYEAKYIDSIKNNNSFWEKEGKRIDWIKPYTKIKDVKYSSNDVSIRWFYDGTLNVSYNCIDRHLPC